MTSTDSREKLGTQQKVVAYLQQVIDARTADPGDDLLSKIASWRDNPRFQGDYEVIGMALLFIRLLRHGGQHAVIHRPPSGAASRGSSPSDRHMGESPHFWLPRIDNRYASMRGAMFGGAKPMQRMPSEYIRQNIWVTTSGMNYSEPLRLTIDVLGRDRVLYANDYPFEVQDEAARFAEAFPLTAPQKAFFEDNARRVFGL